MVVVKPRPVSQHEVATDRVRGKPPPRILGEVVGFIVILEQLRNPEPPRIAVRVLAPIVPAAPDARRSGGVNQGNGFGDHVLAVRALPADADLGLRPKLKV